MRIRTKSINYFCLYEEYSSRSMFYRWKGWADQDHSILKHKSALFQKLNLP